jgi:hypothetical protein
MTPHPKTFDQRASNDRIVTARSSPYTPNVKRVIIHLLIATLMLSGVLASPAVMAWSMPSHSPSKDCTLCQADPTSQPPSSTMTTACVVSVCATTTAIAVSTVALVSPERVAPVFYLRVHSGRLLQGPDPFPPRYTHA